MNHLVIFIAQGFGLGRSPVAPGTVGSILGLFWFSLLISTPVPFLYFLGLAAGLGLSVFITGKAEEFLGRKDPGCIVLDEIAAVPGCFLIWLTVLWRHNGHWPGAESIFQSKNWIVVLAVFVLFRAFDVLKPWPVRQAQNLPGGYGVTADDVLAAVYVNLFVLGVYFIQPTWLL
jgi:phosphatidylglycerophosphatase A